jgi:hypothetical protein
MQINRVDEQSNSGRGMTIRELIVREQIFRASVLAYGLSLSIAAGVCAFVLCLALLT